MSLKDLSNALIHHWFLTVSGGERVCEALGEVLGGPDFYALLCDRELLPPTLKKGEIQASFIERLPRARKWYRYYAGLFPLAVEQFDLGPYDLVVSSDSSVVKGVITQPETCHVCYCHSPMRYAWNMHHEYGRRAGGIKGRGLKAVMHYLRQWDRAAADRVDFFAANSENVRRRIMKYYRRPARVIYPPCDVERFTVASRPDDYYLFVSRLVEYKRADIAVQAFTQNGRRLVVVGDGPEENRLKAFAGKNVEFVGWASDDDLAALYSGCKALVFPADEDFGIVPVEAQAAGRPVLAYGRGGALETVVDGKTGLFFHGQTAEALNETVLEFERREGEFDPQAIRNHALGFGRRRFVEEADAYLKECLDKYNSGEYLDTGRLST